jgi:hypothetical protein
VRSTVDLCEPCSNLEFDHYVRGLPPAVAPNASRRTPLERVTNWGMAGGTLAGMLITDAIMGRWNPWAATFCSNRVKPLAEGPRFMSENSRVGVRFVAGRLLARGGRDIANLAPGQGGIVSAQGE